MRKETTWILGYCTILVITLIIVHWGNQAVTTIAENSPVERDNTIIIDPGHGGVDGGATSCTGKLESEFNLEIGLKLNDIFHLLGFQTKMIRESDISIYTKGETIAQKKVSDLKERVRITKNTSNALLLSIHQNNFSDSQYSGAQVFYSDTDGSEKLAKQLQTAFVKSINIGSKRQVKKASGIYLMENIDCTGILIECGFLSNHEEEAKLRSKEYQQQLCCIIASTVSDYLSNT